MKRCFAIVTLVLLGAVVLLPSSARPVAAETRLERALADLRASDGEWRRERDRYRAQREAGQISDAEANEYATFVASLQREKLENCENVRRIGGDEALEGTDCLSLPAGSPGSLQEASLPEPASTDAEKAGSLEEQLKSLEAELDKELSGAQRQSRERAAGRIARLPQRGGGGNADTGSVSKGEEAGEGSGSPKWSDPGPENGRDTSENADKTESEGRESIENADRKDGPQRDGTRDPGAGTDGEEKKDSAKIDNTAGESGDDDDVVLRQIRQAAEKETDPVLKEKLWEEYRKMKAARS